MWADERERLLLEKLSLLAKTLGEGGAITLTIDASEHNVAARVYACKVAPPNPDSIKEMRDAASPGFRRPEMEEASKTKYIWEVTNTSENDIDALISQVYRQLQGTDK